MRRACPLFLSLAAVALLRGKLEAQTAQPISFQVSGLYNGVFGNVFDGLQDGFGGEAQIRYTPGALSLGAGFQYTVHGLDIFTENARFYGGFFEPRYRIHTGSNVLAPYVSARFSVLKMGFSGGDLSRLFGLHSAQWGRWGTVPNWPADQSGPGRHLRLRPLRGGHF
jgi:hypothetical protein